MYNRSAFHHAHPSIDRLQFHSSFYKQLKHFTKSCLCIFFIRADFDSVALLGLRSTTSCTLGKAAPTRTASFTSVGGKKNLAPPS